MTPNSELTQIAEYLPAPSSIVDHGQACCRSALAWLRGVDANYSYRDARWHPPTWLRQQYEWGPVPWPLYWCSIPNLKKLDCGALAAIAVQLYRLRGISAARVQLALRYPQHVAKQWSHMWEREGLVPTWITRGVCYHEACGLFEGEQLVIWDPSTSRWLEPPLSAHDAFGAVMALRVPEPAAETPATFGWGGVPLRPPVWQMLVFDDDGRLTAVSL